MDTDGSESIVRCQLECLLDEGRSQGIYEGAIAAVGSAAKPTHMIAVGTEIADPDGTPVTPSTRFDAASLTKPVATTMVVLRLVERGHFDLDASLARYVPPLDGTPRGEIPIRALLTHTSGLPPYKSFPFGWESREALLESLYDSPLALLAEPYEWFVYSDLNFVHLADALRRATGESLASLVNTHVVEPMRLSATKLGPLDDEANVAATQDRRWRERTLRGEIHDYIGAVMDGESGNAGLFTTASDLVRVARVLLNDGHLDGNTVLAPSTVETLRTDALPHLNRPHGLGWRLAHDGQPARTWSNASFGHNGFTGTSLWLDPDHDLFAVLLTNHLLADDQATTITAFRRRFHAVIGAAFDAEHAKNNV